MKTKPMKQFRKHDRKTLTPAAKMSVISQTRGIEMLSLKSITRTVLSLGVIAMLNSTVLASPSYADVYVRGHQRGNGTWVEPHYRSNPDSSRSNNWSTYPNVNPHTGQRGTSTYQGYGSGSLGNGSISGLGSLNSNPVSPW